MSANETAARSARFSRSDREAREDKEPNPFIYLRLLSYGDENNELQHFSRDNAA